MYSMFEMQGKVERDESLCDPQLDDIIRDFFRRISELSPFSFLQHESEDAKELQKKVDSIIDFSELGDFIHEPIRSYSSGMYMRLAFSVAVAVEPEILLIDEILAVGDAAFQAKCMDHLHRLQKQNKTIVIVTHDAGVVERFCDEAVWLENAKVKLDGAPNVCIPAYLDALFGDRDRHEAMRFDREAGEEHDASIATEQVDKGIAKDAIVKVAMSLEGKAEPVRFLLGDPMTIQVNLSWSKEVEAMWVEEMIRLAVTMTTLDQTQQVTFMRAVEMEDVLHRGTMTLTLTIPSLLIPIGPYLLSCKVITKEEEVVGKFEVASPIYVTQQMDDQGNWVVEHEWQHRKEQ